MIGNIKLKVRTPKEETVARRIKTEMNQNPKKISLFLTKSKQPLIDNKKLINQTEIHPLKRTKPTKSTTGKAQLTVKLTTEPNEKYPLPHQRQQAVQKLFGGGRKENGSQVMAWKMNKQNKEDFRQKDRQIKEREKDPRQYAGKDIGREIAFTRDLGIKDMATKDLSVKENANGKDSARISGQNRYVFQDKVGSGTFGIVHKARDKVTLQVVAIKRVFQDKKYKNRELQILKMLNHPNCLKIRDSFFTHQASKQYLNVVMDFYPSNLYDTLQKYRGKEMPRLKVKVLAYQMFRGLMYLGGVGIAHRDVKPQNVLVDEQSGWKLLICDFGSAKKLVEGEPNLAYICSRCYRAPELIFGSTDYTPQIDMWSAGCILVQMLTCEPIFRSQSNIDQLVEIIKILGTPTYDQIMDMNKDCQTEKYQFPKISAKRWEKVIRKMSIGQQYYDLVSQVLQYSPKRRLTPAQALAHPFFDELRQRDTFLRLRKEANIPDLFNFTSTKEISSSTLAQLIPDWYNSN